MACLPRVQWPRIAAFLLSLLAASNHVLGQEPTSREELREPVYRVDQLTASPGVPPVVDSTATPGEKPLVAPPAVADAKAPATTADVSETKIASLTPTTRVGICESQRILNEAVAEAQLSLKHIQENVKDYTCLLVKREKVHGEVLPTEFMETKIRNRRIVDGNIVVPFSVHMRFIRPAHMRGREVLFIEGQHNSQVRVKEGGTRGKFLPSVLLSPTGRFALQDNRYPITELGIENLVQRLIDRSQADTSIDACEVAYRNGAKIDGRPCKFLQVKRPVPKTGEALKHGMNVFLAQVFIDEELNIPIRYAAYDWPVIPGGPPEVVEEYTYQNLKVNVGLTDADFDYQNPNYNF